MQSAAPIPIQNLSDQWPTNLGILQSKIYEILAKIGVIEAHVNQLLDLEALTNYWSRVFTHKSINADPRKNYETTEFFGDKAMNYTFSIFVYKLFGDAINQANGTLLINKYMSKEFQAEVAERLGLVEYVRFDPESPNVTESVKEDVIEAFFGCLDMLANDRLGVGMGTVYCFNLMKHIFNDIKIVLEDIQKDPVTLLKELFEKFGWGIPQYLMGNSDDPKIVGMKVEVRNGRTGTSLGVGYGSKAKAEANAARNALKKLADEGFTVEVADKNKLARQLQNNPEFDKQYKRVEAVIRQMNEAAQKANKTKITEFKIKSIESRQGDKGKRFTFSIEVAFQGNDGKLNWRTIQQATGDNQDTTKIQVMKELADKYGIP